MAKELIISANVHEKKVAILEDGVVTEFYVERRDENQGVVGNLYKGRVMKVLPGMQSAFVDIGLERDAFLYVSDFTEFMEEEEEIDFREAGEERPARPDERPRRQEQRRPGAAAKPAPTAIREEESTEQDVRYDDIVEQLAEIADESVIPPPPTEDEIAAQPAEPIVEAADAQVEEFPIERITDEPFEVAAEAPAAAEAETVDETTEAAPVEAAGSPAAEEAGKPRRRSRKKAAEKPEPKSRRKSAKAEASKAEEKAEAAPAKASARKSSSKPTAKKSRRNAATEAAAEAAPAVAESFERITDDDLASDAGDLLKDAIVQEKIIEKVHEAEYATPAVVREPEPEWRVGSFRAIEEDEGFQRVVDESAPHATTAENVEAAEENIATPFRHIGEVLPGWLRERMDAVGFNQSSAEDGEAGEAGAADEDREAEVRDRGPRAEFAQRRGGRGRRRRHQGPPQSAAAAGDETIEGEADAESAEPVIEEPPRASAPRASAPRTSAPRAESSRQRFDRARDDRPRDDRPRDDRPRDDRRGDGRGDGRGDRRPDSRSDQRQEAPRQPSRRAERGGPPTISELLHEGQEILVQIAKEPIAKKGARITSHIALPGRYLVYMPTVNHVGVSRKIPSDQERIRLKRIVSSLREREGGTGGFIARTACAGHTEQELQDDMRYLLRTWADVRKKGDRVKAPAMVHQDLDLVQRILRDQVSEEFSVIRIDNEVEYARIVEFVHRVQPRLVNRVKLYTGNQPIFEKYSVQPEIDKAVRPRVWLKSGGYIVINQTEALVAIDVNTGKFVGKSDKLEDTITRTNLEAVKEIVRQIRLRDLGGIIVLDLIDMEERKNRQRVMTALQQELAHDRAPSKILSINDFGLVAITRKRVKQSLERTLCSPCPYCTGAGMVKSAQTMCFEILEQAKAISKQVSGNNEVMLRVSPQVAEALRTNERAVFEEVEAYFNAPITLEPDPNLHQEQYDFAVL
ncbi:MAG TPA: Rne/Rng family ribonuclease [Blastocatellia bacterium]|nr:Rne/Rng family ribonuclease [Blastocatellia bacterium]